MNFKILCLLPLLAVLIISGCTIIPDGGGTEGQSNVLNLDIRIIPSSISSKVGQTLSVLASVENVLDPEKSKTITSNVYISDDCDLFEKIEPTICPDGSKPRDKTIIEGIGCDAVSVTSGGHKSIEWSLKPKPLTGTEQSCRLKLITDFDDEISSQTSIEYINYDYFKTLTNSPGSGLGVSKNDGPVKIYLSVESEQPKKVVDSEKSFSTISLNIENRGEGTVQNVIILDSNIFDTQKFKSIDNCQFKKGEVFDLKGAKKIKFLCNVEDPTGFATTSTKQMTISAKYTYQLPYETDLVTVT